MSSATSVQGGAESIILSARVESIILSVGGAKEQSTKSCNGNCGDDGGGRGDSGGDDRFDIGSGDDCSEDSNGDGNVDSDSGDGDSSYDDRAESIMLSAGGVESIILSAPSLKLQLDQGGGLAWTRQTIWSWWKMVVNPCRTTFLREGERCLVGGSEEVQLCAFK